MKIQKIFEDIVKFYYRKKVLRELLNSKREDLAVFNLMENYLIKEVMSNKVERREELVEIQKKIEEFEKFIKFIKESK